MQLQSSIARRAALMGILMAAALILSYIEGLASGFIPVPGVKIGISNIATVFVLYRMGFLPALGFGVSKALLSALFTGRLSSLIFSLFGAVLSIVIMAVIKKTGRFSLFGVNLSGAVLHIVGQLAAASLVLQTAGVWLFLPWLGLISAGCGAVTWMLLVFMLKIIPESGTPKSRASRF